MKTNDIYVCAFPKSGITYFGFLLAAARLRHNGIPLVPTMYNIDFLLIDTHKMAKLPAGNIWRDGIGDLYKTHSPFFPAPNVIYLLRDPTDTLRSYFHFRRQLGARESAAEFLAGPEGITAWINHARSWLLDNRSASQSIFVSDYENLLADPRAELRALGAQLGLEFSGESLDFAVHAAGIGRMREIEASFSARNPVYSQFDLEFVRKQDRRLVEQFTPELLDAIRLRAQPVYEQVKSRLSSGTQRGAGAGA